MSGAEASICVHKERVSAILTGILSHRFSPFLVNSDYSIALTTMPVIMTLSASTRRKGTPNTVKFPPSNQK